MSLINDALNRAKQAQQANPPPRPNLPFRAAGPSPNRSSGSPMLLLAAALAVFVLGGLLIIFALQKGGSAPQVVNATQAAQPSTQAEPPAAEPSSLNPAPSTQPEIPPAAAPAAVVSELPSQLPGTPAPSGAGQPTAPTGTPTPAPDSVAVSDPAESTVAATIPVVAPEPPKPATPKLQGIFYSPSRPSAVVNGKSVFIGSSVGEFRILAITPASVTLGTASQTNVLSLDQ